MSSRRIVFSVALLAALSTLAAPVQAGNALFQGNLGFAQHAADDKPCPARDLPTFEVVVPIPNIIDPFAQDELFFFCDLFASKKDSPVGKVKGTYETELILLDNLTGDFDRIPIDSGKFKTDSEGSVSFDFDIPSELFADGFESGDVSAWSYTRSDFTSKKKVDNTAVQCSKGAVRDN